MSGSYTTSNAAAAIERRLSSEGRLKWEKVDPSTIKQLSGHEVQLAWSLDLDPDHLGIARKLYLAVPSRVPEDLPIAIVRPSAYQEWPHAERSGRLCLWENISRPDVTCCESLINDFFSRIGAVVTLSRSLTLAEDRRLEFEREWLSYWLPAKYRLAEITSGYLVTVPPRSVTPLFSQVLIRSGTERAGEKKSGFRTPGGFWNVNVLFSSELSELRRWGTDCQAVSPFPNTPTGLFIPLQKLASPAMPESWGELQRWVVACAGQDARADLVRSLRGIDGEFRQLYVIFGLQTSEGYALAGLVIQSRFRWTGLPSNYQARRRGGSRSPPYEPQWVIKGMKVDRADRGWMEDRNVGGPTKPLHERHVLIVGCGMLGSPIAESLARSGVGKLTLVDPDEFEPANVGRHVLGASYIGQMKADALAHHLRANVPSVDVKAILHDVLDAKRVDPFDPGIDLVICVAADWRAESFLFAKRAQRSVPKNLMICWLEPYAAAGHALLSVNPDDDLFSLFDAKGEFKEPCTLWPPGLGIHRLAACQAAFQPAGMSAAAAATAMCATTAIDQLQKPASEGVHAFWFAEPARVNAYGGSLAPWTSAWPSRAHSERALFT